MSGKYEGAPDSKITYIAHLAGREKSGNRDMIRVCRTVVQSIWQKFIVRLQKRKRQYFLMRSHMQSYAADQEHMDPENHRLLAEAIYQKVQ